MLWVIRVQIPTTCWEMRLTYFFSKIWSVACQRVVFQNITKAATISARLFLLTAASVKISIFNEADQDLIWSKGFLSIGNLKKKKKFRFFSVKSIFKLVVSAAGPYFLLPPHLIETKLVDNPSGWPDNGPINSLLPDQAVQKLNQTEYQSHCFSWEFNFKSNKQVVNQFRFDETAWKGCYSRRLSLH